MRSNKKSTRFWALIMAIAMCLSLSATAFAATPNEKMAVVLADEGEYPVPMSNWYTIDHMTNPLRGTQQLSVCPPAGASLKLIITNDINQDTSAITVKTTKNGGWWASSTVNVPKGQRQTEYTLISNCNGEPYTVEFSANPGYFFANIYW